MDSALNTRLLGVAVLIALLIIFVPMFLGSSPPKEASAIQNLDIPPLPERKFRPTRTICRPVESSGDAQVANPAASKPSNRRQWFGHGRIRRPGNVLSKHPMLLDKDSRDQREQLPVPSALGGRRDDTHNADRRQSRPRPTPRLQPHRQEDVSASTSASMPTRATPMRSSRNSRTPGLPRTVKRRNTRVRPPSACASVPMQTARPRSLRA